MYRNFVNGVILTGVANKNKKKTLDTIFFIIITSSPPILSFYDGNSSESF